MPEKVTNVLGLIRKSLSFKLLFLGGLLLILLIPIGILGLLRESRADRAANVEREIGSKWGGVMHVESPLLIASLEIAKQTKDGKTELEKMPFFIVPEDLQAECTLTPEIRHRGIYQAVLYKGTLHLKGSFRLQEGQWEKRGKILLDDLRLACAFSNAKAVKIQSAKLQDQELLPRRGDSFWRYSKDFFLPAKEELSLHHGDTVTFDITMELKGTRRFPSNPLPKTTKSSSSPAGLIHASSEAHCPTSATSPKTASKRTGPMKTRTPMRHPPIRSFSTIRISSIR